MNLAVSGEPGPRRSGLAGKGRGALGFTALVLLSGCSIYRPVALPARPSFPAGAPHLSMPPRDLPLPELAAHVFDPSDGLDMTEVAMLAVANNPELKVARSDAAVSRAQAFAAGLLPDPQLVATRDVPTNGDGTFSPAYSLGLSYDINALLTHSAAKQAAEAARQQTDLNLLWQEWMVVAKARLLFAQSLGQQKLLAVLQEEQALVASRHARLQEALATGDVTLDTVSADLIELQSLGTQMNELSRRISSTRQDLNALLGLAPGTRLHLTGGIQLPDLDETVIRQRMTGLGQRRPDLLALQAGYESQEQRFRQAVLAQFPAFNLGLTRARDTSGLYTRGLGITLSLPIFNRNRGNIAIEQATRQRLHDEYQMRLNAAYEDTARILEDQLLLEAQRKDIASGVEALSRTVAEAEATFASQDMDELAYTQIRTAWLAKRAEAIAIEQTLLEQRVMLQALVGGELPLRITSRPRSTPKESKP